MIKKKKIVQNNDISILLLAGGKGLRLGGVQKQFLKIKNKTVIDYSLDVFHQCNLLSNTVIVVPSIKISPKKISAHENLTFVQGGETRKESILCGLNFLEQKETTKYVIIHDAARPLISKKMIKSLIKEINSSDASFVGIPAIDLLFEAKNNIVKKAHNKVNFSYGFTPQIFKFKDIIDVYKKAQVSGPYGDADSIEILKIYKPNSKITIIDSYPNIKLTYKEDLKLLKKIL